jgi:S-DNA-T family DNA segregation ATPase FtsK/SpoIIIE
MARKNGKRKGLLRNPLGALPAQTTRGITVVILFCIGTFLLLAAAGAGGIAGSDVYNLFASLLGVGYFLLPVVAFVLVGAALKEGASSFTFVKIAASALFILAGLGFLDLLVGLKGGGIIGAAIADPMVKYFDLYAASILLGGAVIISLLVVLEGRITLVPIVSLWHALMQLLRRRGSTLPQEPMVSGLPLEEEKEEVEEDEEEAVPVPRVRGAAMPSAKQERKSITTLKSLLGAYTPPPLSLLERDRGRPGVGDIKGNANIIKRTLQNFGIVVELDEISIGPSVTRYAIKPAEGVRLSKIVSLQTNLELALAAHPVRIEAPIPGKSLVGIEVPNSTKVTVGLGTLLEAPEFAQSSKPLLVALGRDIAGASHFGNIGKMPHLLIAGATGSGKSVAIHALITSLLYRLGPSQLRFLMIDPKRVELTLYRSIPHLLSPVLTDPKRAIMALRWACKEMERRYNLLEENRVRDIESYHNNILAPKLEKLRTKGKAEEGEEVPEAMPYLVIVIDELADIMQTFPRELEASVVRLAQMSRAVGIHLILSTQRPSVNVITGLIKANIPARVALQVASQVDSRTILDTGGAEKLLGSGDMLYLSADAGKPVRLQSAYISESEVKKVVDYIAKNNEAEVPIDIAGTQSEAQSNGLSEALSSTSFDDEEVDDDMYEAARTSVIEAGKASTSYIQRKLRVGYARAARLMDMLEERGVIGPQDGAKPREVLEKSGGTPPPPTSADVS